MLWRLSKNGALDTTFGPNHTGVFLGDVAGASGLTNIGTVYEIGRAIIKDSDGKYVVTGTSFNGTGKELAIWKFSSDGVLDTSFGTSGAAHFGSMSVTGITGASQIDIGFILVEDYERRYIIAGQAYKGSAFHTAI